MTMILAKMLGFYFLAIGLASILNPGRFRRLYQQILRDDNFLFFGGLMAILIGSFIVSVHNVWILGWPLLITLLGWWSLIKGFCLLVSSVFIKPFSFIINKPKQFYQILGIIWTLVGILFLYHGYIMPSV